MVISSILSFSILFTGCLSGKAPQQGSEKSSGATQSTSADPKKPVVLKYMTTASGLLLEAEKKVSDNFTKANPNVKVEFTAISSLQEYVTAIKAKFASGEAPDVYEFQGGNRTVEFAKAGLLLDLTDEPFMSQSKPEDRSFNSYNGKVYGFAVDYQFAGLFVNMDALKKFPGVKVPESFPQLLDASEQLRKQKMESPIIMAGKDVNNVSQFDFQYLSTVVLFNNPNYYKEMLDGKRKFNDPFMKDMFAKFGQAKNYMSKDSLGVDNEEAIKRFIRGDGVFWIAHGSTIPRLRELGGDNFNFNVYPSVLQDKVEDRVLNVGLANSIQIVKASKNLDAAKAFVTNFVSKGSGEILAKEGKIICAFKGVDVVPDKSIEPLLPWLSSKKKSPHVDLVWIPGIKDTMKEVTQKWYMGEPLDNILNEWESQHQRLLKANPDFITNYGK